MSEETGEFIRDGEPGNASDVDGTNIAENGTGGTAGNDSKPTNIINGYESFNPFDGPVTERITDRTTANGEPKRTKSGKIDRRTKAGRNQTETADTVSYERPKKLVSLEQAILSLHDMAAGIFGIPELSLSEPEAKSLNDAVLEVSKYYVSAFDPKKVAIFNLVTCMGGIYAVRVMAYRNRMHLQRKQKLTVMPQQQPAPIQPTGKATTIEEYLGGQPPAEGAMGF